MKSSNSNKLGEAMEKMSVRISVCTAVLLVLGILVSGIAIAKNAKVNVCHVTGNGTYRLINISEKAVPAHLAHGDALPGDPVPGVDDKIFGDDCSLEDASPEPEPEPEPMSGYEVVTSGDMSYGDGGWGGWSCPPGKVVIGGGFVGTNPVAASAPGTPGSVWPHYTFPANEYGWVVRDAPDGLGNTIKVYAICANP